MAQNGEDRYFEIDGKRCRVLEERKYCAGFSYIILEGFKERYEKGISCPRTYYDGVEYEFPEAVGFCGRIYRRVPPEKITREYREAIGLGPVTEADIALDERLPLRELCDYS